MTLDKLKSGQKAIIITVGECSDKRRLMEMGLVAGTVVTVGRRSPFGDPCEIRLRGYTLTLRKNELSQFTVKVL